MRGEVLFEKMTGISEVYITEAALVSPVGVETTKKKPFAALSRAWRRGLSAACICLVAVMVAVGGVVTWEQVKDTIGPGSTSSERFTFYYQIESPDDKHCTALPGDTVCVDTAIQNEGKAFEASNFFARTHFVLQSDASVVLEGVPHMMDKEAHATVRTIKRGRRETMSFIVHIPEDATLGVYDLVLSYGEEQQVFSGVLTVENPEVETDYPPVENDHPFSFGYEPFGGGVLIGNDLTLEGWIVNEGDPFTYIGDPDDFKPWSATLYHMELDYAIEGDPTVSGRPPKPCNVRTGQRGTGSFGFYIPEDAPTGSYGLILAYHGATQAFEDVLTVSVTTDTEPLDENGLIQTAQSLLPYLVGEEAPHYRAVSPCSVNKGVADVRFYLYMRDIRTPQCLTVSLDVTGAYLGHELNTSEYSAFLPRVTDDMIEAAKQDVIQQMQNNALNMNSLKECGYSINEKKELLLWQDYYYLDDGEGIYTERFSTVLCHASAYILTMPIGSDWLYEPLDETYAPGEEVTVRIKFATDVGTLFFLNGEVIDTVTGDDQLGYWEYSFLMPERDSEIIFQTYDGMAPYSDILEAYYKANPKAEGVRVSDYGTYGDGVRVAIIEDARLAYTQMEEEHRIGPAVIRYAYGNFLQVLHNGVFCSLAEAYEGGLLSDADLATLENLHRELYPYLYADSE